MKTERILSRRKSSRKQNMKVYQKQKLIYGM